MGNVNNPYADQYGFRVIEIKSKSPAEKAGLQVSTDFIVTINGRNLNELETSEITRHVAENENKPVNLLVWSSLTDSNREVVLTPSRKWPGEGLLGVIIRYDRYDADKLSSDQHMSFDKLYEGEGGNTLYSNDKLQRTQSGTSPVKEGSFMGIPGLSKKKSGVQTVQNPARNIDLDHEFSFDKIYAGDTFQENSPLPQRRAGARNGSSSPTPEGSGTNTLSKAKSTPDVKAGVAPATPSEDKIPKKRLSFTSSFSGVFSWAGGGGSDK